MTARAIPWVPDQALSPYRRSHHFPGIRRALWAIEELNDDRVAWHQYANLTYEVTAIAWKNTISEKKKWKRRR